MMDAEKNITTILSIVGKSSISEGQKKVIIDCLNKLAITINLLAEKNNKLELKGHSFVGDYDSVIDKMTDLFILLGITEQIFNSINPEFARWMVKSVPGNKYTGKLMNWYLLEGMQVAWLLCEKLDKSGNINETGWNEPTWEHVRDCFINPESHIENSVNKSYEQSIMAIIEGCQNVQQKEKLFNQYLKK